MRERGFIALVLLVFVVCFSVCFGWLRPRIERDLSHRTVQALQHDQVPVERAQFEGRDGVIRLGRVTSDERLKAQHTLNNVFGVRTWRLEEMATERPLETVSQIEEPENREPDSKTERSALESELNRQKILFPFDSSVPESEVGIAETEKLAKSEKSSSVRLMIEGHTDSTGSADYNLGLSQRRAKDIRARLSERGISESSLYVDGRGEDFPAASNRTREGRHQNRRVVIRLLGE